MAARFVESGAAQKESLESSVHLVPAFVNPANGMLVFVVWRAVCKVSARAANSSVVPCRDFVVLLVKFFTLDEKWFKGTGVLAETSRTRRYE